MDKVLTISIAAYNMEPYINRTLDSLLDERIIEKLEIFVVDDGGSDKTLEIAKEYAAQYPNTIYPIHKENGGYGSTINTSVKLATGKYFKVLDGDDWYDKENLVAFVELLSKIDADYVITQAIKYDELNKRKTIQDCCANVAEGLYLFEQINFKDIVSMYCSTFKTSVLKYMKLHITEHCFYTDFEYAVRPIPYIETIYIWHSPVYVYYIGRIGQSMSVEGIKKHYKEHQKVFWNVLKIYQKLELTETKKRQFIALRLVSELIACFHHLCFFNWSLKKFCELQILHKKTQQKCPDILKEAMKKSLFTKIYVSSLGAAYPMLCLWSKWKKYKW